MDIFVSNFDDAGIGSLRWAISEANALAGFDTIGFDSALTGGTITLSSALEVVRDQVALSGLISSQGAPPQLAINFNGNSGQRFSGRKASGSSITELSLVSAGGDGLTLDASGITVQNNYIGVGLDGTTGVGNGGHGIRITRNAQNSLIGTLDPLTGTNLAQQVSNVISANAGNGILVEGSRRSRIANNRIGGSANQGNDPTKGTFAARARAI